MKSFKGSKLLSNTLYITPYVVTLCAYAGFMLKTIDSDFLVDKRYSKLTSEIVNEKVNEETIVEPKIVVENLVNEIIEKQEEPEEILIEEEPEIYSTDLLDQGYEFEDVDFDSLKEINSDACAWIKMDNIDYPVVQGEDNDYYLSHDIYGKDSHNGTIFLDANVNSFEDEELSTYSVLYGHKMKSGKMFSSILNYKKQEYFDNNQFGVIYTPDGYAYKAEFFAGRVIDANNLTKVDTDQDEEKIFNDFIKDLKENSTFESNVDIDYGDKILVLVTCSYETNNSRYCLYAKLTKQYTNYNQIENNFYVK